MVSDVTRIGEWSPVCKACWWDEGSAAHVGDWFTGRNVLPDRTWETRSEVIVAERGREFAFVGGRSYVRALRGIERPYLVDHSSPSTYGYQGSLTNVVSGRGWGRRTTILLAWMT